MSGIFKSVKKAFKKVGKLIKKIAPVLIIAAAVYFGGAYLMSVSGGATAAQGASVAKSFTKSAGVWKSFMGGLANGNAASSAAAYAESSYQSYMAGATLSEQVVAGSHAVKSLGYVHNVELAVKTGNSAQVAYTAAGGGDQGLIAADAATNKTFGIGPTTMELDYLSGQPIDGDGIMVHDATQQGGVLGTSPNIKGPPPNLTPVPYPNATSDLGGAAGETGGTAVSSAGQDALDKYKSASGTATVAQPSLSQQLMLDYMEQNKLDSAARHAERMEILAQKNKQNMYGLGIQGLGLMASVYGASQPTADEEDRKRRLNWKMPTGPAFDIVNPKNPQGGLIL